MATRNTITPAVKEIITQLKEHFEEHYDGLHREFLAIDSDRKGWISKQDFAAQFQAFSIPITHQELAVLMDAFGSHTDQTVSYLEFCNTLVNGPWAPLTIKQRTLASLPPKAGDNLSSAVRVIIIKLKEHLEKHYDGLRREFLAIDTDRNGWISTKEFGAQFRAFNIPITKEEMTVMMDAFGSHIHKTVSYVEFCNTLVNSPWAPLTIEPRPEKQPSTPIFHIKPAVKAIIAQLKEHLEEHYDGLRREFLAIDTDRNGWISTKEFWAQFRAFNIPITKEELAVLAEAFGSHKDGTVSYVEFCRTLVDGPWAPLTIKRRITVAPDVLAPPAPHAIPTPLNEPIESQYILDYPPKTVDPPCPSAKVAAPPPVGPSTGNSPVPEPPTATVPTAPAESGAEIPEVQHKASGKASEVPDKAPEKSVAALAPQIGLTVGDAVRRATVLAQRAAGDPVTLRLAVNLGSASLGAEDASASAEVSLVAKAVADADTGEVTTTVTVVATTVPSHIAEHRGAAMPSDDTAVVDEAKTA